MLDTNIVSDLIRNPNGNAAEKLAAIGEDAVCLSMITAAELQYGIARKSSDRLRSRVKSILATVDILPFDRPCDAEYGRLRAELEAAGTPIGPNDLLIAAHALTLRITFVTANVSDFRHVRGLTVENPLE